jgi:beta-xylosidase
MLTSEIHVRDPFVLPVPEEGKYYLYGTTAQNAFRGPWYGSDAYASTDLEHWEGPIPIFRPPPGFWATRDFWAPEAHRHAGRYFLFMSVKADGACRGTQIFVADGPRGPFGPHSDGPVTPRQWECLDGTLFVDEAGQPWIVFCHEWVQVGDGEVCAMKLSPDLRRPVGKPVLLFTASQAPWAIEISGGGHRGYVTDGPFLWRGASGRLFMVWASFDAGGERNYVEGCARSESGLITGPWVHQPQPLFTRDGGHGMIFRTFGGDALFTVHAPNTPPDERPVFLSVRERGEWLVVE